MILIRIFFLPYVWKKGRKGKGTSILNHRGWLITRERQKEIATGSNWKGKRGGVFPFPPYFFFFLLPLSGTAVQKELGAGRLVCPPVCTLQSFPQLPPGGGSLPLPFIILISSFAPCLLLFENI
jgi:hypothetical protein